MVVLLKPDNIIAMPEKRCTGPCERTLPATAEFFSRHKGGKHGLNAQCKRCVLEKRRVKYQSDTEYRQRVLAGNKASHDRSPTYPEYNRAHVKAYYATSEGKASRKAYRLRPEVREQRRADAKDYHSRPEVREKRRLYNRAYKLKKRSMRPEKEATAKRCKCGETRLSEFGSNRSRKDGLNPLCKACIRQRSKERNAKLKQRGKS